MSRDCARRRTSITQFSTRRHRNVSLSATFSVREWRGEDFLFFSNPQILWREGEQPWNIRVSFWPIKRFSRWNSPDFWTVSQPLLVGYLKNLEKTSKWNWIVGRCWKKVNKQSPWVMNKFARGTAQSQQLSVLIGGLGDYLDHHDIGGCSCKQC